MRFCCLLLAASALCLAQNAGQPRMDLDRTHHDFGTLKPDTHATTRFRITNGGSGDLEIFQLRPSCGCTSTTVGKDSLGPGESTQLEVDFSTAGLTGKAEKNVRVYCNDPAGPVRLLTFEADILPDLSPAEEQVQMRELTPRERRKVSVKFTSWTGQPILVADAELSDAPWLGVATRTVGVDLWVDLDLAARKLPAGKPSGTDRIALRAQNPRPSVVQLSVHWARRGSAGKPAARPTE